MLQTLKSKITFKRILAFFALVFILWVICDYCLFRYLVANKSGWYVYDKKLYDEILAINQNRANAKKDMDDKIKRGENKKWEKEKEKYIDFIVSTREFFMTQTKYGNADKDFFKEMALNAAQFEFVSDELDRQFPHKLSNGYEYMCVNVMYYKCVSDEIFYKRVSLGIHSFIREKYYYKDSNLNTHIIAERKGFAFEQLGLWVEGDEGAGFWIDFSKFIKRIGDNVFYVDNNSK